MTRYRYGATLRPFGQLNLNRLDLCPSLTSFEPRHGFRFGTAAFHRRLTDFEVNQFDLEYLGEEECPCAA